MKKSLIAISAVLLMAGCKEVPPIINFTPAVDTTYVITAIPATDAHNALVEEFTGQSCSNCPQGHSILEGASGANPGRVNIIGYYQADGSPLTAPPSGSHYNFTSDTASIMGKATDGGVGSIPNAGIDRVPVAGSLIVGENSWISAISSQLTVTDSLNLSLQSSYSAATNLATIIATITYTQPVTANQDLTIVVLEDSMVDRQEYPLGYVDTAYLFTNVFRGMLSTPPAGDAVLDSLTTKGAGRVYRRTYTYTPSVTAGQPAINPAHCRVIGFVTQAGTNRAMQSAQTKLMQ